MSGSELAHGLCGVIGKMLVRIWTWGLHMAFEALVGVSWFCCVDWIERSG